MVFNYQVLMLAAGEGTRLRPLTETTPKCLVPIHGRPLLSYWLTLFNSGPPPQRLWINTCYLAPRVEQYLSSTIDSFPNLSIMQIHEATLQGTAGTLINLLNNLVNDDDLDLLVVHADNLSHFDLESFLSAHYNRPENAEITIMTFNTDSPRSSGIIELDSFGIMQKIHEKVENPPGCLANAAVYLFSSKSLRKIKNIKNATDISTEILPAFEGKAFTWHNKCYHRDIGTVHSYQIAQIEFQNYLNNRKGDKL